LGLRMIEVHVADDLAAKALEVLAEVGTRLHWREPGAEGEAKLCAVIDAERSGAALDGLHRELANVGGLRVLVLPLDAALPAAEGGASEEVEEREPARAGVSVEEIQARIAGESRLGFHFAALVVLSTLVAAIGLAKNNTAAVIGAMVVAPLLGPNMGLALGLTLGDAQLVRAAFRTALSGLVLALTCAVLLGLALDVDPGVPEIASRAHVDLQDILLALAAGAAGTLAYTTGAPAYLIGVMVAVALLPPTVAAGLLASQGELRAAAGAGLLVLANVAAVNLAAMLTLVGSGVRPRDWWTAERARRGLLFGILAWSALLGVLAGAILLSRRLPGTPG